MLAAGALLAAGNAPALAVVSFLGEPVVPSGTAQRLTLSVPLDGLPGTTRVEVTTAAGWTVDSCEAAEPWICRSDPEVMPGLGFVRWDRNPLAPPVAGEGVFVFTARAGSPGVAEFTVSQWSPEGQARVWSGPAGSEDPGPRLIVGPPPPPVTSTTLATAPSPGTTITTAAPVTTTTTTPGTTTTAPASAAVLEMPSPPVLPPPVAVDWDGMAEELAARPEVLGISLSKEQGGAADHYLVKGSAAALLSLVGAGLALARRRLLGS